MTLQERVHYAAHLVKAAQDCFAQHPEAASYAEALVCGLGHILPELVMAADGKLDIHIYANPGPGRDIWALARPAAT